MLTRRQLYELYDEGPDAMIGFVASLVEELAEQGQRLGWRYDTLDASQAQANMIVQIASKLDFIHFDL